MAVGMAVRLGAVGLLVALGGVAAPAGRSQEGLSLMTTLAEWQYPGSTFSGAQASDGGNPTMQSVKFKAVLTTPASVAMVVDYYSQKLGIARDADGAAAAKARSPQAEPEPASEAAAGAAADPEPREASSITLLEDSEQRPVEIVIINVHRRPTSTTLVISRAAGETQTHIAWSHFIRL